MYIDKRQITYKAEGDGFQADALVDEGYCYQLFMKNDPPPRKCSQYLPLHERVMALFDSTKEVFHCVGFNNFYNSTAFSQASSNHPLKPLVHVLLGKEDVAYHPVHNNKRRKIASLGTVKVAKLEGDPGCSYLIASSVYNTKPVHYFSMISNKVK